MPSDQAQGSLDALGIRYETDKASTMVRHGRELPGHDYLRHYETAIRAMDHPPELILDLGAGPPPREFASARMWADYVAGARVVAVDIRDLQASVPPGIEFLRGDLGDVGFVASLAARFHPDLVVEDASHRWPHQLLSLFYFLPVVRPGGLFIWEDLHVSGTRYAKRYAEGEGYAPVDFLALLSREVVLSHVAESGRTSLPATTPPGGGTGTAPDADPDGEGGGDGAASGSGDIDTTQASRGLAEMMARSLAPLVDSIAIFSSAAILVRGHPSAAQRIPGVMAGRETRATTSSRPQRDATTDAAPTRRSRWTLG